MSSSCNAKSSSSIRLTRAGGQPNWRVKARTCSSTHSTNPPAPIIGILPSHHVNRCITNPKVGGWGGDIASASMDEAPRVEPEDSAASTNQGCPASVWGVHLALLSHWEYDCVQGLWIESDMSQLKGKGERYGEGSGSRDTGDTVTAENRTGKGNTITAENKQLQLRSIHSVITSTGRRWTRFRNRSRFNLSEFFWLFVCLSKHFIIQTNTQSCTNIIPAVCAWLTMNTHALILFFSYILKLWHTKPSRISVRKIIFLCFFMDVLMVCSYVFLMASKMSCDLVLFIVTFCYGQKKCL